MRVILQLLCNIIAVCLSSSAVFTFLCVLILPRRAFSLSSTKWLLPLIFVAVHCLYGQVNVSTAAKAADQNCDLLGIRGDSPQPANTFPSPDVCFFSELVGRLSDGIHVHPSLGRSWSPLAGSQRSSDTRSCSGRTSCARPQRSRASSPRC